ncbi:hypothetical protein ABEF92_002797 [Exophiala dermatitidis]|uniref:LYR motif-containing protein Cup1-like N-terminal domain-containing protein n=1 Tax=Exophiala dermatitidis (strain ATCC 34100 / CBS 525.76 / NIH/UT8656) TaxID=858893 RepID=H6CBD8_EXODN|nr:uncharacterized protein HMPREF1120_09023 [Exophiala dermatitidis NIH/UT8656]EHY61085.1 hypothetical protein HMPREF1120_09023 [Exophiala dermatitidis NIH/UT8656]
MTTNPVHLYRALLRECSYLPLPRCRSSMKAYVTESFRRWLPKYKYTGTLTTLGRTNTGRVPDFLKQVQLLHRGRKFHSTLKRANEGYLVPLEKVLRMTYGRTGPRRHEMLEKFIAGTTAATPATRKIDHVDAEGHSDSDNNTNNDCHDDTGPVPKYSRTWHPPPQFQALIDSQAEHQHLFGRSGPNYKVKKRFTPPATTTWGEPLSERRYRNLKHDWHVQNLKAVLPPLPEQEYKEVYDLVTGAVELPAPIPRRPKARVSPEEEDRQIAERHASMIHEGPRPGPRAKDDMLGRPHRLTPRLFRRTLARAVLKQAPLVKAAPSSHDGLGMVFVWDDGLWQNIVKNSTPKQTRQGQKELLFS